MAGNVIVIGGAGELGRAIVDVLVADGCVVGVGDISCGDLGDRLARSSSRSFCRQVDVTDRESLRSFFAVAGTQFGALDAVINTAGIPGRGQIDEVDEDLWDRVLAVNLSGVFWSCRFALPLLRRAAAGAIVNIASVAGLREQPGSVVYSASKGGVVMLSRTLAADLAREAIRVFAVCPPPLSTRLVLESFERTADPAAARRAYEERLISGRLVDVDEVATLVGSLVRGDGGPFSPEALVV
jgi:NAD(P)-dependent dehydrogenase (short-subunit alcohol dehydrogenase family)